MSELRLYLLIINIPVFFQQQQILRKHFILLDYTTMPDKCCSVEPHCTYQVIQEEKVRILSELTILMKDIKQAIAKKKGPRMKIYYEI